MGFLVLIITILIVYISTNDIVTIQTSKFGQYSIVITSLTGQIIHNSISSQQAQQLDISPYPKGVYLITVMANKFVTTERVIKL